MIAHLMNELVDMVAVGFEAGTGAGSLEDGFEMTLWEQVETGLVGGGVARGPY
jgi:hypothetical protein